MEEETKKIAAISAFLALSMIASFYFLNSSGFSLQEALDLSNAAQAIKKITSIDFILFAVIFPLSYAIAIVCCRFVERKKMHMAALASFAFSMLVSLLIFPNLGGYFILAVFYLLSILLAIEGAYLGFSEFKKLAYIRTIGGSVKKAVMLLGLGIFVFSALAVSQNPEQYVKGFEKASLSMISGNQKTDYAGMSAELIIMNQQQTLDMVMQAPQYSAIMQKEDVDVKGFVSFMTLFREKAASPEYKEFLKGQISENNSQIMPQGETDVFSIVKQQFPIFGIVEQYFWFFEPLLVTMAFFTLGNLIIPILAIIYGLLFAGAIRLAGIEPESKD